MPHSCVEVAPTPGPGCVLLCCATLCMRACSKDRGRGLGSTQKEERQLYVRSKRGAVRANVRVTRESKTGFETIFETRFKSRQKKGGGTACMPFL